MTASRQSGITSRANGPAINLARHANHLNAATLYTVRPVDNNARGGAPITGLLAQMAGHTGDSGIGQWAAAALAQAAQAWRRCVSKRLGLGGFAVVG